MTSLLETHCRGPARPRCRPTDTTLGRDVAIKVLPEAVANDPERMARFEREARLLASLNHPHIAAIHGVGSAEGVRFRAMELIEGAEAAARPDPGCGWRR
jgi:serine/threonine protein kinase